jgi:hypothetical protein
VAGEVTMALMAKVTYEPLHHLPEAILKVYLDGRYVGIICRRKGDGEAYFYKPLTGPAERKDYRTLDELKASLQGKEQRDGQASTSRHT